MSPHQKKYLNTYNFRSLTPNLRSKILKLKSGISSKPSVFIATNFKNVKAFFTALWKKPTVKSVLIIFLFVVLYFLFFYESKTAEKIKTNSRDPELQKVFNSFKNISSISDPLNREYKIQQEAKFLKISVDDYRRLFEIYKHDKEYLPDYPKDPISPLAWFHWLFIESSREKRSELLITGFFIALEKGVFISGAVAIYRYFKEAPIRKKQEHYQAWQMINSAIEQEGSGGRIDALQDLNKDKVSLKGLTAKKAYLIGIILKKADLQGANLQEANLQEANLQEANLQGANLQEANLQEANLQEANLQEANLQRTQLQKAQLQKAQLLRANLQRTQLQKAQLQKAQLQGANFWGAQLQKAQLLGANLQRANLSEADLWGAKLQGSDLWEADLQRTQLQRTQLQRTRLLGANLQEANLQRANLQKAQLLGANLQEAQLQKAQLQGANLQGANLQEANLLGANLQEANLQGANLQGANLLGANLQGADLRKVKGLISEQLEMSMNWDKARYEPEVRECLGLPPENQEH